MDFLHVLNWKRAEPVVKAGSPKVVDRGGIKLIPLEIALDEVAVLLSRSPRALTAST